MWLEPRDCRLNDPSTWPYATKAYLHALNWAIERWEFLTEGAAVTASHVQIRINETTFEALLLGSAGAGKDVVLVLDLHITGGGFAKTRWTEGTFTIRSGATQ